MKLVTLRLFSFIQIKMSETTVLSPEECASIVKKFLKIEQIENLELKVTPLENKTFSVKITVKHDDKEKKLNFFAKIVPDSLRINHQVLRKFDINVTPKLFFYKSNLLLFEDLTSQDFYHCQSDANALSLEHLKIVINTLSRFHAACFAYEERISEIVGKTYRLKKEYPLNCSIINLEKPEAVKVISSVLDDQNEEHLSQVVKRLEDIQFSKEWRRTICHNHLAPANLMFRYKNKTPIECKILNFECEKYVPPVYDVLHLCFFTGDEEFRQKNLHFLLNYYYEQLREQLRRYSLNIDNIVPMKDWQKQAHCFLPLIKLQKVFHKNECLDELKEDLNCPLLSRQDCYEIVRRKFQTTDYKLVSFEVNPLDKVSGYLGDYHKLLIKVQCRNEEASMNCFIKCVPKGKSSKEVVQDSNGFSKEVFMYETLVPKFQELGINIINDCLPACYLHRIEDLMIFEDLDFHNYKILSSLEPYDLETLTIVLKNLAKLHASSLIYEEKLSETLNRPYRLNEDYKNHFKESFILNDEEHSAGKLTVTGLRSIPYAMKLFSDINTEKNQQNFEKFWPKFKQIFFSVLKTSDRYRNVVTHGDLWSNNILIKSSDGQRDCRFVDYQLLRYFPPGHDFMAVLYLTTNREIRQNHEEDLMKIYYNEVGKHLESFNYSISKILPYEDFIGGVNLMKPQMIIQAAIYSMFTLCSPDQISSLLTDEDECNKVFFKDRKSYLSKLYEISPQFRKGYKERLLDIYDYCNTMST